MEIDPWGDRVMRIYRVIAMNAYDLELSQINLLWSDVFQVKAEFQTTATQERIYRTELFECHCHTSGSAINKALPEPYLITNQVQSCN